MYTVQEFLTRMLECGFSGESGDCALYAVVTLDKLLDLL